MKKIIALLITVLSLQGSGVLAQTGDTNKKELLKQRIDSLSPEQRKGFRKLLKEKRNQMTPEQKQEMREQMQARKKERMEQMTPEQKAKLKAEMKQRRDSTGFGKKHRSKDLMNQ